MAGPSGNGTTSMRGALRAAWAVRPEPPRSFVRANPPCWLGMMVSGTRWILSAMPPTGSPPLRESPIRPSRGWLPAAGVTRASDVRFRSPIKGWPPLRPPWLGPPTPTRLLTPLRKRAVASPGAPIPLRVLRPTLLSEPTDAVKRPGLRHGGSARKPTAGSPRRRPPSRPPRRSLRGLPARPCDGGARPLPRPGYVFGMGVLGPQIRRRGHASAICGSRARRITMTTGVVRGTAP